MNQGGWLAQSNQARRGVRYCSKSHSLPAKLFRKFQTHARETQQSKRDFVTRIVGGVKTSRLKISKDGVVVPSHCTARTQLAGTLSSPNAEQGHATAYPVPFRALSPRDEYCTHATLCVIALSPPQPWAFEWPSRRTPEPSKTPLRTTIARFRQPRQTESASGSATLAVRPVALCHCPCLRCQGVCLSNAKGDQAERAKAALSVQDRMLMLNRSFPTQRHAGVDKWVSALDNRKSADLQRGAGGGLISDGARASPNLGCTHPRKKRPFRFVLILLSGVFNVGALQPHNASRREKLRGRG